MRKMKQFLFTINNINALKLPNRKNKKKTQVELNDEDKRIGKKTQKIEKL